MFWSTLDPGHQLCRIVAEAKHTKTHINFSPIIILCEVFGHTQLQFKYDTISNGLNGTSLLVLMERRKIAP